MGVLIKQLVTIAAMDQESEVWIQLLVFVILASGWGLYIAIKSKAQKHKATSQQTHRTKAALSVITDQARNIKENLKENIKAKIKIKPQLSSVEDKTNFSTGMEILELSFLTKTVEDITDCQPNEISIRSMCFNELARRNCLASVESNTLKHYALNKDLIYDKSIQRIAMEELAQRTSRQDTQKYDKGSLFKKGRKKNYAKSLTKF